MANAIGNMMFQCVFDGSISFQDNEIERRPYHRDCECALHEPNRSCSKIWCIQKSLSFPKKTRGSLAMTTVASTFNSTIPCRSSSTLLMTKWS
ncbi:hypothetical protein LINPERPRIM_LOCUS37250 [Linum perenne]